jgi:hypothetical protein
MDRNFINMISVEYPKKSKKDILWEILSLVNELLFPNFPGYIIEQKNLSSQLGLDMKNNIFSRLTKKQQMLATIVLFK